MNGHPPGSATVGATKPESTPHSFRPDDGDAAPAGVHFGVALQHLARRTSTLLNVSCTVRGCPTGLTLDGAVGAHLLGIAQEAVTNAHRHGRARRIVISLSRRGQHGRLAVEDDGGGIPASLPPHDGTGLCMMAHRAAMVGGRLRVRRGSRPDATGAGRAPS